MIDPKRGLSFTKRLFFGDMVFNWFLGGLLTVFPGFADRVLTTTRFFPITAFRLIGIGFLIYSAWQTFIIAKERLVPRALRGAAWAAFGPVVVLTGGLILWAEVIAPFWTIVLWVGDVYMLLLGLWYIWLARNYPPSVDKKLDKSDRIP
jgi:hypothetical protein